MFYNQNEIDSFFTKNIDTNIYKCSVDGFFITEQQILEDMYNDFYKKFNTKYNLPIINGRSGFFDTFQLSLPNNTVLNIEKIIFYSRNNFDIISLHGLVITIVTKNKITNKFKPLKKLKEKLEEFDIGYKQHILGSKKIKIIQSLDSNVILFDLVYTNNFDFKMILLIIYAFYFDFDKNNNWIESQYFDYIIHCNDNDDVEEWRLNYMRLNYIAYDDYATMQSKIVKNVTKYIC